MLMLLYKQNQKELLHLVLKEKESQLIGQIHILFYQRFGRLSSVHFQALMMKKLKLQGLQ